MGVESFYSPTLNTLPDSWKRSSFTQISLFWMVSNNLLASSDYIIRKIKDQGSIQASIEASGINLFDRQIETGSYNNRPLRTLIVNVLRVVALTGVVTFASSIGIIWHAGNCVYEVALWAKEEKQIHFKEHAYSLQIDLFSNIAFLAFIIWSLNEHIATCSFTMAGMLTWLAAQISIWQVSPTRYSLSLKSTFGLVNENGWPLTFNEDKDLTINTSEKKDRVVLGGYFYELWGEQEKNALEEFKQVVDLLQLELNEEELKTFSENPENFLPYLDKWKNASNGKIPYDESKFNEFTTKAKLALENCNLIKGLIWKKSSIRLPRFLFCPESCRAYFSCNRQVSEEETQKFLPLTLLDNFKTLLTGIKEARLAREEGPSDSFIKIKKRILDAQDAYEVLDVMPTRYKPNYTKAYRNCMLLIHPDKVPEDWKKQASDLSSVVEAAYKFQVALVDSLLASEQNIMQDSKQSISDSEEYSDAGLTVSDSEDSTSNSIGSI